MPAARSLLIEHACFMQVLNYDKLSPAAYSFEVAFEDAPAVALVPAEQRALASIYKQ
jgi:hypothetical protein